MSSVTIRKVVITKFSPDPDEAITITTATLPSPNGTEVQVRVLYSGFAGADVSMSRGLYPLQRSAPLTPGYCLVGRVVSSGGCCRRKDLPVDALVVAVTVYDAEAERANVDEKHLVPVPDGVDPLAAAALVLDWNTAYGMVEHAAKIRPGHKVFVHGVSGAVGHATAALCLLRGATVYGTASERKHERLREIGVEPFVYTDKAWMAAMQAAGGVDAVFDPLGFESWDESYAVMATTRPSTLVGYGTNQDILPPPKKGGEKEEAAPGRAKTRNPIPTIAKFLAQNLKLWDKRRTVFYYINRDSKDFLPDLLALMELTRTGKIAPPVKGVWDMDNVVEAHRSWGKGVGIGSMFIKCSDELK